MSANKLTPAQLLQAYHELQAKYSKLLHEYKKLSIEDSWAKNPDRSGGAFTQEEIDRYKNGGW